MRNILLICAAAATLTVSAQTDSPVGKWASLLDGTTTAGDQATGIAVGKDNTVYWLTTMGSTAAANDIKYNDETLFEGENYTSGSSYTGNLCLLATDADGSKRWVIYSNSGDWASSQGNVAVDAEGNVIFTAKVRHGDFLDTPINIIDANGDKVEFGGAVDTRSYNLLVAKANADGQLLWHRYITLSTTPGANATKDFISDAVTSNGLAVDASGNIYVAGNYSAEMTVSEGVTLPAVSVTDWTGDSQSASGDMFVLKYDADGNYLGSAIGSDGVTRSQITNLQWANGALYFLGTSQGAGTVKFAGQEFESAETLTPIVGQLDQDLQANWLAALGSEAVANQCIVQNMGLTVSGGTLWIAGQFNGKFYDAANPANCVASEGGSPREGLIIKLDATSGKWLAATNSRAAEFTPATARTGLTGYLKILQNPSRPEKCYAIGYVMNAAVGVVVREYDATTLEANVDHAWSIATGGGAPSCTAVAYDEATNTTYFTGRGNKAFELISEVTTPVVQTTWAVLLGAVEMPADMLSGVQSVAVEVADDAAAEYFDLQGRKVGTSNLAPGIYVKRSATEAKKIIVK